MMCICARNGTLRKAILALVSFEYIFFSTFFLILGLSRKRGAKFVPCRCIVVPVVYRVYKSLLTLGM